MSNNIYLILINQIQNGLFEKKCNAVFPQCFHSGNDLNLQKEGVIA